MAGIGSKQIKNWYCWYQTHDAGQRLLHNVRLSDVLQIILSLQVFQPVRWPASFDAWSVLQQSVILPQFRVALGGQPAQQRHTFYMQQQTTRDTCASLCPPPHHWPVSEKKGDGWKHSHVGQREGCSCEVSFRAELGRKRTEIENTSRFDTVLCVPDKQALPSQGSPPTVWAQWPGLPCFSSEPNHAALLQARKSHRRRRQLKDIERTMGYY